MFAQVSSYSTADKLREIDVINENKLQDDDNEIVSTFQSSQAYHLLMQFLVDLSDSVKGKPNSALKSAEHSDSVRKALEVLDSVDTLITNTPALEGASRFGNPAFRQFTQALSSASADLTRVVAPKAEEAVAKEVARYLAASFGDERRIDYGTGHELNFVCWLLCLMRLGMFATDDYTALVLLVFNRYIRVVRRLQTTYLLEPAGSRGVWGLDDYHFLPFYFGAAQLIGHKHLRPKSVRYKDIYEHFADEYMYFEAIRFVNDIKLCSFAEHSPMLNDITTVKLWEKVNSGLMKMYKVDVVGKFAVVQHFLYCSVLSKEADPIHNTADDLVCASAHNAVTKPAHSHQHPHAHTKDMPCCSDIIRFPSVLGARAATSSSPSVPPASASSASAPSESASSASCCPSSSSSCDSTASSSSCCPSSSASTTNESTSFLRMPEPKDQSQPTQGSLAKDT